MPYIGPNPAESFTSFATQEFSTSATTSYTLDHAVANENEIALFINNVRQQPGSGKAYTASGTALTLSAATASTDTMYCVFLGRALQTVTPATNSITAAMVGNDLISGKDALTSAPADTDEFLISDAGVLKRIDASLVVGGGKINQVVSTHTITNGTMSSNSFADISGVTVDITPSASNSKILIFVSLSVGQTNNSSSFYKLLRDSTVLGAGSDAGSRIGCSFSQGVAGSGSSGHIHSVNYNYLDSPSTTSQITYKVQAASYNNALLGFNRTTDDANSALSARPSSVITAMEVLA